MKVIKVLGSGCTKCNQTMDLIEKIAAEEGAEIQLEKVSDPAKIMAYNILSTPGVVVDEQVVHRGSIPKKEQVLEWL